jgi:hypothetical protein
MDLVKLDNWIRVENEIEKDFSNAYNEIETHLEFKMLKKLIKFNDAVVADLMKESELCVISGIRSPAWSQQKTKLEKSNKILSDRIKKTIEKSKKIAEFLKSKGKQFKPGQVNAFIKLLEEELYDINNDYKIIESKQPNFVEKTEIAEIQEYVGTLYDACFKKAVLAGYIKSAKGYIKEIHAKCQEFDDAIQSGNGQIPDLIEFYNTRIPGNSHGVRSIITWLASFRALLDYVRKAKCDSEQGWDQLMTDNFLNGYPKRTESPSSYTDLLKLNKIASRLTVLLTPYGNSSGKLTLNDFANISDPNISLVVNEKSKNINELLNVVVGNMRNML